MNSQGLLLFLVIEWISWCAQVKGLKCYICDTLMDSCYSNVSSKYLKDCHDLAIGCTTFSLENGIEENYPEDKVGARWFQRSCLYKDDLPNLYIPDASWPWILPSENERIEHAIYHLYLVNSGRRENGIPEMPRPNIHTFAEQLDKWRPINRIKWCGLGAEHPRPTSVDGCNNWEGEPPFPSTEGFPAEQFRFRENYVSCWKCQIGQFHGVNSINDGEGCLDLKKDARKGSYKSSNKALGCSLHAIYLSSGSLLQPKKYFERDFWFPGDHFCLQQRFPSTRKTNQGRSLMRYKKFCKNGEEQTCSKDLGRTFGTDTLSMSYSWTGYRAFHSAKEFNEFINCKLGVRMRTRVEDHMQMVDVAEIRKEVEEFKEDYYGSFAYVGFHLCGPSNEKCNDWPEHELHSKMGLGHPPTSTTTASVTGTTINTLKPSNNDSTEGGGPGEVTDEGCCVEKKRGGGEAKLSFGMSIFLPLAVKLFEFIYLT